MPIDFPLTLVDTHCHINTMIKPEFDIPLSPDFSTLAQPIIDAAYKNDVRIIINVGTSLVESENCVALAKTFKNCFATLGIHPNDINDSWQSELQTFELLLQSKENKIVGIGEIGLDRHYPGFNHNLQEKALRAQIELALAHKLPIVIHTRDAGNGVLTILADYKKENPRGIIHCFSEDMAFAQEALELGFLLGIGGPLTYAKNEVLRQVFSYVPLESIVLETDAPFLPPQALRGKPNHPENIGTVALYLAQLRNTSLQEVARVTTHNALTLFDIDQNDCML